DLRRIRKAARIAAHAKIRERVARNRNRDRRHRGDDGEHDEQFNGRETAAGHFHPRESQSPCPSGGRGMRGFRAPWLRDDRIVRQICGARAEIVLGAGLRSTQYQRGACTMKLRPLICLTLVVSATAAVARQGAAPPAPIDRLRSAIERVTKSVNATWGIFVKSIATGEELALDADRQMETMSTIKIP